jgi:hypothetical protein
MPAPGRVAGGRAHDLWQSCAGAPKEGRAVLNWAFGSAVLLLVNSARRPRVVYSSVLAVGLALAAGPSLAETQPGARAASAPPAAVARSTPPENPPAPRVVEPSAAPLPGQNATPSPPPASPLNPKPEEFPRPGSNVASAELDALMSRVAALRSRIAALSATLFSSKLRVELRASGDTVRLKSLKVSVDGGLVYTAPTQTVFEQPQVVYEHAVAAGPHVLALEVEQQDLRQPQFSTWQTSRFVVVVPERRQLWTRFELEEDSSMGEDFPEDQAGHYELNVRLHAEASE